MSAHLPPCVANNQLHAHLCSAISDPVRIRLLYLLAEHPHTVSQLIDTLDQPQSSISRHLGILRAAELVRTRRDGRCISYSLGDDRVIQALEILRAILRDCVAAHAELFDPVEPV